MAISPKTPSLRLQKLREIASGKVGWYDSPRIDGHKVDRATAGAIVAVYDALSPANRERYLQMDVGVMAPFAWKNVTVKIGNARRRSDMTPRFDVIVDGKRTWRGLDDADEARTFAERSMAGGRAQSAQVLARYPGKPSVTEEVTTFYPGGEWGVDRDRSASCASRPTHPGHGLMRSRCRRNRAFGRS